MTTSRVDPYVYDVIVVGAGHAGIEAARASARLGARTAMLTVNCDSIGQMSCNPAIGGVGKGQIAREIDALGGLMGELADATAIQFRLLNRGKGPAMHSPRAQSDKKAYQRLAKLLLEREPNLTIRQESVEELLFEKGRVVGARCRGGADYRARAVILTTGTFLQALMHTGEVKTPGGRAGDVASRGLSASLESLGIELRRFKTGTPPRLNGRTIDFSKLEPQPGDAEPVGFSFVGGPPRQPQMECHLTATNEAAHELIRSNLHRAPMYTGQILAGGPRYCPSIEDKVVKFADRTSHQIFLEPEGRDTLEYYCNGISTSLPRDVQERLIPMIRGLEHAEIMRFGYAVEYDYAPPTQLLASLETKAAPGLYLAGQINGTTGYEEAAAQGLMAGINAALAVRDPGRAPVTLERSRAYIGVLIDDLVTKGVDEPYRMFTSRAEYRLLLRHDTADLRLTPLAIELGLADDRRIRAFESRRERLDRVGERLRARGREGRTLEELLRRHETVWEDLRAIDPELPSEGEDPETVRHWLHEIRYGGYIARQEEQVERLRRLEDKAIPERFDFLGLTQLRHEAREKFHRIRPRSIGQAARISGISPSDVAALLIHLKRGAVGRGRGADADSEES